MKKPYKYRLKYWLWMNPETNINQLALFLKMSERTVNRWANIKMDEPFDIPFSKVLQIADFFNVEPQGIYTDFEKTLNQDINHKNQEL